MRVAWGSITAFTLACGAVGCGNPATDAPPVAGAKPAAAPAKSAIPAGNLTQIVLEVPGMS
jgi:hypothetical protein